MVYDPCASCTLVDTGRVIIEFSAYSETNIDRLNAESSLKCIFGILDLSPSWRGQVENSLVVRLLAYQI